MKRILIPVALLLFSAGVYFLFVLPNQIEQKFNDAVPENVEVNYKDFQVNLLDKSVVVETLKLEDDKVRVEMGRAEVKTEEYASEMIQVQLNEVTLTDKENEEIYKAQQVTIQDFHLRREFIADDVSARQLGQWRLQFKPGHVSRGNSLRVTKRRRTHSRSNVENTGTGRDGCRQ